DGQRCRPDRGRQERQHRALHNREQSRAPANRCTGGKGGAPDDQLEVAARGRDRRREAGQPMIGFRDRPIRQKLMISLLLTSFVVMLLMEAAYFAYGFFALRQSMLQQLATLGKITAANSTAALAFDNQEDAQEILSALSAEPSIVAAAIYDQ